MQLGMIGAGRMGGHMAIRLMKAGHECVVYARHEQSIKEAVDQGAKGTTDLKEFVRMLSKPRAVWLMVPAASVDKVLDDLASLLEPGDIVVDGGNSYYHDDIRRAAGFEGKASPICGRGGQRRCLGTGTGLLYDDRRGD